MQASQGASQLHTGGNSQVFLWHRPTAGGSYNEERGTTCHLHPGDIVETLSATQMSPRHPRPLFHSPGSRAIDTHTNNTQRLRIDVGELRYLKNEKKLGSGGAHL